MLLLDLQSIRQRVSTHIYAIFRSMFYIKEITVTCVYFIAQIALSVLKPFKDEAQTALFKDPLRTAQ
jgi:hypothetical protein